ncbi:hypothetical protein ACFC8N_42530 [Streptomyces sp. NPDC055966]|uniref:hypothetical protein n=1 Tax=Streptomyces sp. NPDC055966 TaxID=3345669 RepID=UPI0035E1B85C
MATTRTAKKTTPPQRDAAAKKTAPAPGKAPAKKTAARKPAAKKALSVKPEQVNRQTAVDLRKPLPVRRRVFVGPMGATEQAAIRAALAAAKAQLPVPVRSWEGPIARLADGTVLTHSPAHATTDQQPTFHAAIRCPHGAVHVRTIHTARELDHARALTAQCKQRTDKAPELAAPNPAVRALGDALTHATSATDDTQPIPVLPARADDEEAKEHPEP